MILRCDGMDCAAVHNNPSHPLHSTCMFHLRSVVLVAVSFQATFSTQQNGKHRVYNIFGSPYLLFALEKSRRLDADKLITWNICILFWYFPNKAHKALNKIILSRWVCVCVYAYARCWKQTEENAATKLQWKWLSGLLNHFVMCIPFLSVSALHTICHRVWSVCLDYFPPFREVRGLFSLLFFALHRFHLHIHRFSFFSFLLASTFEVMPLMFSFCALNLKGKWSHRWISHRNIH